MAQIGIQYTLTGPDGTRAVFNNSSDPDFIGYLDAENGITGLLDTADVRESFTDHVEGHGAAQGNNWLSRRTGTLQGIIWPDPNMAAVNQREGKLKRASRAFKGVSPAVLSWSPDGYPPRQISVWRQGRVAITARRPKNFLVPLASADPYTYAQSLSSQIILPLGGGSGADQGFTSPMRNPISTTYNLSSQGFVTTQGDVESWPIFTLVGPITNPGILNNSTGLQMILNTTLQSTDTLVVDTSKKTVLLNGGNKYSAYAANFASNTWWSLLPSTANDIRLLSSAFSTGAQLTVQWRDAWE